MTDLTGLAPEASVLPPAPEPAPDGEPAAVVRTVGVDDLTTISRLLTGAVAGCDHACVIVTPRRGLEIVGSSSPQADAAAAVMLRYGKGMLPADMDAADRFVHRDLCADATWPEMSARIAEAAGVRGLVGVRLVAGERRIGVLTLFCDEVGALDDVDEARLATLAHLVGGWVVAHEAAATVAQLREAVGAGRQTGRAIGLLMAERGLFAEEAAAHLKRWSNRVNVRARQLADEIVRGHEARVAARRMGGAAVPPSLTEGPRGQTVVGVLAEPAGPVDEQAPPAEATSLR